VSDGRNEKAAEVLLAAWRANTRMDAIPEDCRPGGRRAGYDVAAELARQTGDTVAGWKIAATSEAGQQHINVDGPLCGRIYGKRLLPAGSEVRMGDNIMKVAEAEFAFRFARDLPPRGTDYSRDEALAAVDALLLSIEVPDSRYNDFTKVGAAQLIADTACASWLVLGDPVQADWRGLDLSTHVVTAYRNGQQAAQGSGKAVLGDPRLALTWFVNEAARFCGGVKAGQFVTTGTCIVPITIVAGDRVEIDYGVLGKIGATIS
jgi:2-keto-4-pentenoate hydratase